MKQRLVNQEMDTDIFQRLLGMPAQALLLVGLVLIAVMLAGGILQGFLCGMIFFFILRRFLKEDPSLIEWLMVTFPQKKAYGPKGGK
jgi:type IV secretory pathway VirB3-like protein